MSFTAPIAEQLFVLKHITGIEALAGHNRFADTTTDVVQAIVEGIGEFAAAEFAPLNRIGEPNDIANAVLYLASDESRFMTGAELKLDGGISAM